MRRMIVWIDVVSDNCVDIRDIVDESSELCWVMMSMISVRYWHAHRSTILPISLAKWTLLVTAEPNPLYLQNRTEEYGNVRKIEEFPHKKNIPKQSQKREPPSPCWLCGDLHFARSCPFRYHIWNICLNKGHKESKCKSGTQAPSKNTAASKKAPTPKSLGVVSSTYETDGIDRRQYVILSINGQKVRLQIDTPRRVSSVSMSWRARAAFMFLGEAADQKR